VKREAEMRAVLGTVVALLLSVSALAETLLENIEARLKPLSPLERLYVLKVTENEIANHMQELAAKPANTNNFTWVMKVTTFSYGALTLTYEREFPDLGAIYNDRTELYADLIRGKLKPRELEQLERKNELNKAAALNRHFQALKETEKEPNETKAHELIAMGGELALMIVAHAKVSSTSPQ
jgi:hypothetical protein